MSQAEWEKTRAELLLGKLADGDSLWEPRLVEGLYRAENVEGLAELIEGRDERALVRAARIAELEPFANEHATLCSERDGENVGRNTTDAARGLLGVLLARRLLTERKCLTAEPARVTVDPPTGS